MLSLAYCLKCQEPRRFEVAMRATERYMVDLFTDALGIECGPLIDSHSGSIEEFACSECGHVFLDEHGHPIKTVDAMRPFVIQSEGHINYGWSGHYGVSLL